MKNEKTMTAEVEELEISTEQKRREELLDLQRERIRKDQFIRKIFAEYYYDKTGEFANNQMPKSIFLLMNASEMYTYDELIVKIKERTDKFIEE